MHLNNSPLPVLTTGPPKQPSPSTFAFTDPRVRLSRTRVVLAGASTASQLAGAS